MGFNITTVIKSSHESHTSVTVTARTNIDLIISPRVTPFKQMSAKTRYDIFISLRYAEAEKEALELKGAIEKNGLRVYICQALPGVDMFSEISSALVNCTMAVIMGSSTYGKKTPSAFSTAEELKCIMGRAIPNFLIKMTSGDFTEDLTNFVFSGGVSYQMWLPGQPMPGDLMVKLLEKHKLATVGKVAEEQPDASA